MRSALNFPFFPESAEPYAANAASTRMPPSTRAAAALIRLRMELPPFPSGLNAHQVAQRDGTASGARVWGEAALTRLARGGGWETRRRAVGVGLWDRGIPP